MKYYILNAEDIKTKDELHRRLALLLSFPAWYGNNLDALFDILSERRGEALIVRRCSAIKAELGEYGGKFLAALADAAAAGYEVILEE